MRTHITIIATDNVFQNVFIFSPVYLILLITYQCITVRHVIITSCKFNDCAIFIG